MPSPSALRATMLAAASDLQEPQWGRLPADLTPQEGSRSECRSRVESGSGYGRSLGAAQWNGPKQIMQRQGSVLLVLARPGGSERSLDRGSDQLRQPLGKHDRRDVTESGRGRGDPRCVGDAEALGTVNASRAIDNRSIIRARSHRAGADDVRKRIGLFANEGLKFGAFERLREDRIGAQATDLRS